MDQLFVDLIGKPKLNPPKVITIVVENFSLLADQARFLRATLAIPTVKQLPVDTSKKLIQIGFLPKEIREQVETSNWTVKHYMNERNTDPSRTEINNVEKQDSLCDKLKNDLSKLPQNSIIVFNDFSKLELLSHSKVDQGKKLLILIDKLKRVRDQFIVVFYQSSIPKVASKLLRDLEYISDAVVKVKSCKAGYFKNIWFHPVPSQGNRTLIPCKVETQYYTCKIGKFYYSSDLLCFYDKKKVPKNYDLNSDPDTELNEDDEDENRAENNEELSLSAIMRETIIDKSSEEDENVSTLPYTVAQNPEKSRIFYYPDKDDDIDEDDPDNDLGI